MSVKKNSLTRIYEKGRAGGKEGGREEKKERESDG